jgi:hypothetical protein
MSIASANWTIFDPRDEVKKIRDEIYSLGSPNFDVSQDFILKSMLVLSDTDVRFKLDNFGRNNVAIFESKWNDIRASLVATFSLLEQLGFNDSLLRAKNAAIPIAYYIYKNDNWALTFQITNSQGVVKFGDKTQVSVQNEQISMTTSDDVSATLTKSAITLQTSSSIKIEMASDSVTINGHLKVT